MSLRYLGLCALKDGEGRRICVSDPPVRGRSSSPAGRAVSAGTSRGRTGGVAPAASSSGAPSHGTGALPHAAPTPAASATRAPHAPFAPHAPATPHASSAPHAPPAHTASSPPVSPPAAATPTAEPAGTGTPTPGTAPSRASLLFKNEAQKFAKLEPICKEVGGGCRMVLTTLDSAIASILQDPSLHSAYADYRDKRYLQLHLVVQSTGPNSYSWQLVPAGTEQHNAGTLWMLLNNQVPAGTGLKLMAYYTDMRQHPGQAKKYPPGGVEVSI